MASLLLVAERTVLAQAPTGAAPVEIVNVVLGEEGLLRGRAVNSHGQSLADVSVAVYCYERQIAQTRTDATGNFQIRYLREGNHAIVCGSVYRQFRLWSPKTAPSNALPMVLIATADPLTKRDPPRGTLTRSAAASISPLPAAETTDRTMATFAGYEGRSTVQLADPLPESNGDVASEDGLDDSLVMEGQMAFEAGCLNCHDADRTFEKRKSYSGWLTTTRRMAAKQDADIPNEDIIPIATYLAAVAGTGETAAAGGSNWSFNATISTVWRGTNGRLALENPDFFADVWLGADWQSDGPLTASIMACTSCHADFNPSEGFTFELVEASATLDLMSLLCGCIGPTCSGTSAKMKAGRLLVPFGAFNAQSHPGSYRTVANPLMYDMGRRFESFRFLPVLPAPYSDEGIDINVSTEVWGGFTLSADAYAVNGLQGDSSISFSDSRSYDDNNREPAVGGRVTLSNSALRLGGSIMQGQMQDDGSTPLHYHLAGADVTYRYEDLLRIYFEYALRRNNQTIGPHGEAVFYGFVLEGEFRVLDCPRISAVVRYDTLDQNNYLIFPDNGIDRITWGFNISLPGGSLLLINHEHWVFQRIQPDVDVIGVRWTAAF